MTTKRLAKELGLLRRRGQSAAPQCPSVCKQRFSFLIIIDFESTCWREKSTSRQEIIEFPAVLLNVSSGEVESQFHSYVQPQEHPCLSDFCTELTGITQDQVDSAPPLHIVLSRFSRWLQGLQQERGVVFETDSPGPAPSTKPCAFVTWSDWDLGVCLLYECKRKQLTFPEALKSWIDLRATYRLFYNRKPKGLRGALLDLGIQFTGREHSGLVDAKNTALLAWRMVCDGCLLTITRSLRRAQVKSRVTRVTPQTTGNISCKQHTRPSALRERVTPQMTRNISCERLTRPSALRERVTPQTSVCQTLVSPLTLLSSTSTQLTGLQISSSALAGLSDTTYDPESSDTCWRDGELEPGSYDDVTLGEEPEESEPCRSSSEPLGHSRPESTGVFKTPQPLQRSNPYGPLARFLGHTAASFSVYTDPPAASRPTSSSVKVKVKVTSPLCSCGRRARSLTVGNGGPNHGRVFYCCPVRRQSCGGPQKGCDFFKWETGLMQRTQSLLTAPLTSRRLR